MAAQDAPLMVLKLHSDATLPVRKTDGSAGYDLTCVEDVEIAGSGWTLVSTGIAFTVPDGTYGQIAPRSGLSCKGCLVGAGVIDRDYTGEVKVLLFNMSADPLVIAKGDRVAQLLLKRIALSDVVEVDTLDATERGEGGFGSTGA